MKYNIPDRALEDIIALAKKNDIKKVILFGSRARGTHTERSDIDLAVVGGDAMNFYYDLEEKAWTLLKFDVVNLDKDVSEKLQKEIERDGVVIYGKV
ncbi:MAG: nucleotidyltransferase domain-containing protein [Thermoguttaceae bacterium]|nr:nucleotidyltransferase domain-containing protein [Thermoguttaceae bacterium]